MTRRPRVWPAAGAEEGALILPGGRAGAPPRRLEYRATVPGPIAGLDPVVGGLAACAVEEARAALASWSGAPRLSAWTELAEAVASSWIENIHARPDAVAILDAGGRGGQRGAEMVRANLEMTRRACRGWAAEGAPSLAGWLALHRKLMSQDPDHGKRAGELRTGAVWVGGRSPAQAVFVPPLAVRVPALMADLIAFAGRGDVPVIAQAGIVHAQYETIHPHGDGNGRTGRALIQEALFRRRAVTGAVVPVSAAIAARRQEYYRALETYRLGDLDGWLRFFAECVVEAVGRAQAMGRQVEELLGAWSAAVRPRRGSTAAVLLDAASERPVLDIASIRARAGTSDSNIYAAIDRLVEHGALVEATSFARNRLWLSGVLGELFGP